MPACSEKLVLLWGHPPWEGKCCVSRAGPNELSMEVCLQRAHTYTRRTSMGTDSDEYCSSSSSRKGGLLYGSRGESTYLLVA